MGKLTATPLIDVETMAAERKTNLVDQIKKAGPTVVPALPAPSWFSRWQPWGLLAVVLSGVLGIFSGSMLLHQPTSPNCTRVFWPFASASLRLYCAQEKANKSTLEDLFAAIDLVDSLDSNHPLRSAINPLVERWSNQALDLAESEFHRGDLERAIQFAKKIPSHTTAHKVVKDRIARWLDIWDQGKTIYQKVEAALSQENWRRAFSIMVRLLQVDNRYWSKTQYEALNQKIIVAQQDEIKLADVRRLRRSGGLENLSKALDLAQELGSESIFRKSAQTEIIRISRGMMRVAEIALDRKDLNPALNALQQIPRNVALWEKSQDLIEIAYAMAAAWDGTIISLEDAIAQVRQIGPDRPLHVRAQALAGQWEEEVINVRILQQAQLQAQAGNIEDLATAINQAEQISTNSQRWEDAQQEIGEWRSQLQTLEDMPVLDQAEQLALSGEPTNLQAAIAEAQTIRPGRALYQEAQSRIKAWQTQLRQLEGPSDLELTLEEFPENPQNERLWQEAQRLAEPGTPDALTAAIQTANRIPRNSAWRFQARLAMDNWGEQLLQLARTRANNDLSGAIVIAGQIPSASSAYEAAQLQIQQWKNQP